MTNAEVLINVLTEIVEDNLKKEPEREVIDDGGALEEAAVHYCIKCPNTTEFCRGKEFAEITRELCVRCKYSWLLKEFE